MAQAPRTRLHPLASAGQPPGVGQWRSFVESQIPPPSPQACADVWTARLAATAGGWGWDGEEAACSSRRGPLCAWSRASWQTLVQTAGCRAVGSNAVFGIVAQLVGSLSVALVRAADVAYRRRGIHAVQPGVAQGLMSRARVHANRASPSATPCTSPTSSEDRRAWSALRRRGPISRGATSVGGRTTHGGSRAVDAHPRPRPLDMREGEQCGRRQFCPSRWRSQVFLLRTLRARPSVMAGALLVASTPCPVRVADMPPPPTGGRKHDLERPNRRPTHRPRSRLKAYMACRT